MQGRLHVKSVKGNGTVHSPVSGPIKPNHKKGKQTDKTHKNHNGNKTKKTQRMALARLFIRQCRGSFEVCCKLAEAQRFGLNEALSGAARAACALSLACASPSCACCLSRRPLCPAAAGLRLLSSPSSLFILWLSLPASVVIGFVLVWCFGLLLPFLMLGLQRPPASATVTSSLVAFGGWFVPEFVC